MSKLRYDYDAMRNAIRSWLESPDRILPPWMDSFQRVGDAQYISGDKHTNCISYTGGKLVTLRSLLFIGLRPEDFPIRQMTRDEAVRDYLDSIPEGGELVDGWVKYTVNEIVYAITNSEMHWLVRVGECTSSFAYTFLRLDTMEKYRDAE